MAEAAEALPTSGNDNSPSATSCHRVNKKSRVWKRRSTQSSEKNCVICDNEYCIKCLSKYRFPGERKAPTVCKNCFPEYLHRITFPDSVYSEQRESVMNYLKKHNFPHDQAIDEVQCKEDLITQELSTEKVAGFFATYNIKPKIPVSARVLDKVAMGLLRMSGMYDGGVLNRSYVNRASKRKIKHIEPVNDIQKHIITVPYRYSTEDYQFEKYNLNPNEILEPTQEGEPETFELEIKVYHYGRRDDKLLPVLIWMHGGGFVMGDVDDSVLNRSMSRFCNAIQGVVVSVNYRLAPEFRWPTQPEDAYSVLQWVHEKGEEILGTDSNLISVGGDSAGGNLAAVIAIMSKERNGPKIIHQISVYPGVDGECTDSESYDKYGNGPFLRMNLLRWFKKQYLHAPDANCGVHPYLSPLLYQDIVGLPPLTMITAGYCPLTDHAKKYADRFSVAGIPVTYTEYSISFHGFYHSFSQESVEALTQTSSMLSYYIGIAKDIIYGRGVCPMEVDIRHSHDNDEQDSNDDVNNQEYNDINCL